MTALDVSRIANLLDPGDYINSSPWASYDDELLRNIVQNMLNVRTATVVSSRVPALGSLSVLENSRDW